MQPAMQSLPVRSAAPEEAAGAIATLVTAFSADPAARWAYPGSEQYLGHFPAFARAFGGKAFAHGSAHVLGESAGVALWLPPGVEPDEDELLSVLERTTPAQIRDDLMAVFEQMGRYHQKEPHWYLPLLRVDAPFQGRGYGSALMQHALAACDRDGAPAYLESSNPRNIALYRRCGFEILGTIHAGSAPPVTPMLRPARTN